MLNLLETNLLILSIIYVIKKRIVASRPMVPWYNEEIKLAKKERRAKRKWRITKSTADFNVFKSLKKPWP